MCSYVPRLLTVVTRLHACFDVGPLEDLEPKGEGWEGDGVTGLLLHRLQFREGGVVNQLQQMAIQSHLSETEREWGKGRSMGDTLLYNTDSQ